jgi:hypothetical protein
MLLLFPKQGVQYCGDGTCRSISFPFPVSSTAGAHLSIHLIVFLYRTVCKLRNINYKGESEPKPWLEQNGINMSKSRYAFRGDDYITHPTTYTPFVHSDNWVDLRRITVSVFRGTACNSHRGWPDIVQIGARE